MAVKSKTDSATDCPLSWPEQRRNLIIFAGCTGAQYLAAPVLYVGITQASLAERLGVDTRFANLPATFFFAMTATPALLAWLSPAIRHLKRNLAACYAATALSLGVTAVVLLLALPPWMKFFAIVMQAGVTGAAIPTAIALLWEALGRGTDNRRRGVALGLAFGAGPLLAVLGSVGQTALLGGNLFGIEFGGIEYPYSFALLFGLAAPVMALAAVICAKLIVPPELKEPQRRPVREVVGLLIGLPAVLVAVGMAQAAEALSRPWLEYAGLAATAVAFAAFIYHFRPILRRPILFWATLVTILVYAGNMIPSNMSLYSAEVLERGAEKYAGLQNTLRFACKVLAGVGLGWLLTRSNPRAALLATALIFLAAPLWAMVATGTLYLVAFGIYGAGELIGVYAPNYIVAASARHELRQNMALVTLLMAPAAPAGFLFGAIVDHAREQQWSFFGMTPAIFGFRLSFLVCALIILAGIVLACLVLPRQPQSDSSEIPT